MLISYKMDVMVASHGDELPKSVIEDMVHVFKKTKKDRRESMLLVVKILFITVLVFMIAELMQWAITYSEYR